MMLSNIKKIHLSFTKQILLGAVLGILTGIFFGEYCRIFLPIGDAYSMLLEVAVYPYLISTLLMGLGRLSPQLTLRLFNKGWPIYLLLITLTFAVLIILAQAFPNAVPPLKISSVTPAPLPNIMQLLIPRNLFTALSNNYIPAVILFCILFGIMLQRVKHAHEFFKILEMISNACVEYWRWLVKLAPLAIFFILAYTAGTVRFEQLKDVIEYLLLFIAGMVLLSFWLLPATICVFTGISYRTLMGKLKQILAIAIGTEFSFLAIPYINNLTKTLLAKEHVNKKIEAEEIIETVLLIGFPLAHLGNFFIYLFMQFASTYYNQPFTHNQILLLPFATFLSVVGSTNTIDSTISFLIAFLNLPADANNLFNTLYLITQYGQVILSVMGFAFLSILVTFSYYNKLRFQFSKLLTHIILVALVVIGIALLFHRIIPNPSIKVYQRFMSLNISPDLKSSVKTTFLPLSDETNNVSQKNLEDSLIRIQKTGVLRVGYNADETPFVFYNNQGQLVGYDVAMMYALAKSLKCSVITFTPYSWRYLVNDMLADKFDIAIGDLYVTTSRLSYVSFTEPYVKFPIALVVPRHQANQFNNLSSIHAMKTLRLASPYDPSVLEILNQFLPNGKPIILQNSGLIASAFADHTIDAAFWDAAGGPVWTLAHPNYITIVPVGLGAPLLIAYIVQQNSPEFLRYLNYWLNLQENNGFKKIMYNKWFLGYDKETTVPRWNLLNTLINVFKNNDTERK